MSKQWQLRRGTKAENDIFTGAEGEVTMCTDTKSLRVHDGTTQGGFDIDTVVAFQLPTADNNYTWYRKYASGWVEQGGIIPVNTSSVALPVEMADANYMFQVTGYKRSDTNTMTWSYISSNTQTTTGFTIASSSGGSRCWEVKGMAA